MGFLQNVIMHLIPTIIKNKLKKPSPTIASVENPSPLICFRKYKKAGMTVEAAIVMPLCLFFLLSLGSAVEMIRLHNNIQLALLDAGSMVTLYGRDHTREVPASVLSELYILGKIVEYTGKEYLEDSPLVNGSDGMSLWESKGLLNTDVLDITVSYSVCSGFFFPEISKASMANRFYAHLWNGYDVTKKSAQADMVYMAETGRVWHKSKDCSFLRITVCQIPGGEIDMIRNSNGERYQPCGICAKGMLPDILLATETGRSYHYYRDCPGLKRTVHAVSKEDVEGRGIPPCSRCGNE